jgi:glycosyltransferase involved in cell wall biosynthesis
LVDTTPLRDIRGGVGYDSPVRILLVNSFSGIGGAETHVAQLTRGFIARGHEVHVASPAEGPLVGAVVEAGANHHPVAFFPERPSLRQVRDLASISSQVGPDVVHLHGVRAGLVGRLARLWLGGRQRTPSLVYTVHGAHYLHYRPPFDRIYAVVERALSPLAEVTVFVCRDDLAQSIDARSLPRHDGVIIVNGFRPQDALRAAPAASKDALRRDLGLPRDRSVFLAVGRLHRQKDYPTLLEALARLKTTGAPGPLLLIAGDGPERPRLEELATSLGLLSDDVRFLGPQQDVPTLMAIADGLVMSSLWEGLPYVLLEAMAAGLPIVATDVGGNREVVRDNVNGLLVPKEDPAALAAALHHLGLDPRSASAMARNAQYRLRTHFDEPTMVDSTLAAYRRATTTHGR